MNAFDFYFTVGYGKTRPYMPDVPYMLPASSWARANLCKPALPPHVKHVAADCGGFVATLKWGDYRYTPDEYARWLETFRPVWAATMDYCCEDEITSGKPGVVRERQQKTSAMAELFWREYRDAPWVWVPTVQGWHVEDYQRHARELKPLIAEMQAQGDVFRVGIGTLCARASVTMVRHVVSVVAAELRGVPLHLWGVKLNVLKSRYLLPQVVSVDSAAYDTGGLGRSGHEAREERQEMGLTQYEHVYQVLLPRYQKRVESALLGSKQTAMLL